MASFYLEHYLESVESLPADLQRNFSLMRELDLRAQGESKRLDRASQEFFTRLNAMVPEERGKRLQEMEAGFSLIMDLGDQKVALAKQTYETVDGHIRQLDEDLRRFEGEAADEPSRKGGRRDSDSSAKKRGGRSEMEGPGIDMPVDPNEPTYCLCHQVSYGEMICCDNSNCPMEWFHFACVNLTEQPKGKWLCPICRAK